MNELAIFSLKALRKLYMKTFRSQPLLRPICEQDPNVVSKLIYDKLMAPKPCMIARFGSTELSAMVNYIGVKQQSRNIWEFTKGKSLPWWWNENIINQMQEWSGFFPPTKVKVEEFCEMMLMDIKDMDILGSWLGEEKYFDNYLPKDIIKVNRDFMNPFFIESPWTRALSKKNILVVHPFAESIKNQFVYKDSIFTDGFLPDCNLTVIPAVQSLGGSSGGYSDWFEALEWMKNEINKVDFDICLIGAGAYGFPLAAHVKRIGKKAVHIGGTLQLFFGIKGKRWESDGYVGTKRDYATLYNPYWIRPNISEKPMNSQSVENDCYW